MKKLYYLICDGGDGSASVRWFKDRDVAQELSWQDENFYQNEGEVGELTLPDEVDLDSIGASFYHD